MGVSQAASRRTPGGKAGKRSTRRYFPLTNSGTGWPSMRRCAFLGKTWRLLQRWWEMAGVCATLHLRSAAVDVYDAYAWDTTKPAAITGQKHIYLHIPDLYTQFQSPKGGVCTRSSQDKQEPTLQMANHVLGSVFRKTGNRASARLTAAYSAPVRGLQADGEWRRKLACRSYRPP